MGNFVSKKSHKKNKINKFSQDTRKTVPQSSKSIPESAKTRPESRKSIPESAKSVPQSSKSIPESTRSRPESTKSRPESRKSVPESHQKTIQESSNINGKKQVPPVAVTKLYIIYYSMYGHVERLAQEIKKGAETVEGIEATLWQIPETLPEEVLTKMHAPPRSKVPVIDVDQLPEADAFLFGFPTRFGMMPAQFKAFFDATGGIWREQKLAGKPAGLFYSTGSQGGGQETSAWTTVTILANHAMLYVPPGYTSGPGMVNLDVVKGGSPYGAGTIAGSGSLADKEPNELELEQAFHQGKYTAAIAKKLKSTP